MSPTPTLPALIGPTENALRVLLAKALSTTRIDTYPAWVVLNAASNADPAAPGETWQQEVADTLKVEPGAVRDVLARAHSAEFVSEDGSLTALGVQELGAARSAVAATTSRLLDGIGANEQEVARQVLDRVRRKAEQLLRL